MDKLHLLGMNQKEIKVFTTLSTFGRMNMTKLGARSALPRTTVDAIVRRLVEQGLISKEKVGGHFEYLVSLDELADKLDWIEQRLRPVSENACGSDTDIETVETTEKYLEDETLSVQNDEKYVISGKEADLEIQNEFEKHANERVRILLARSWHSVADSVDRLAHYIETSAVNGTKLEVLACTHIAETLQQERKAIPLPPNPDSLRLNMVPTAYCKAASDMIIFRDVVCIAHVGAGTVERVTAVNIVEAMKHLLDIASEAGWSVNMSAWLE